MMRAIGRGAKRAHGLFALAVVTALAADPLLVEAQQSPAPAATPAPAETAAPAPAATPAGAEFEQPPANSSFTREELEKLLAPIALYPDPLLAQMLPASAYSVQYQKDLGPNTAALGASMAQYNPDATWKVVE